MTAKCIITFSDGSTRVLDLGEKCVELDLPTHMRQSISVNQNHNGKFTLAYTKGLMSEKSWESITIQKEP